MTNKSSQPPHLPLAVDRLREGRPQRLLLLLLAAGTLAGTGCFRATGIQRNPMVAEVIPETGGDRVPGLKAKGGPGDFYLGNDFVQIVVDGTMPGGAATVPLAGAPSGGGIIDAGYLLLDSSFARVSMPGNALHRITPVVNQDPAMEVIFDTITATLVDTLPGLAMTGRLLDPGTRLGTGTSPVAGVTVTQQITVAQLERFFTLTTTVTNTSGAALAIRSIGDCLHQQGGGYHFNIPANFDYQGNALATPLGVQIPQADFSRPLESSVQAPMVGLMNSEPAAATLDSHASLGILPLDADQLLVAADAQDLLTVAGQVKPSFPATLVAGSLPGAPLLADGASLSYRRRLYIVGGQSVAANLPSQATGLFNAMDSDRYITNALYNGLKPHDTGTLTFTLSGTSVRQGPRPTEIRIERDVAATTPPLLSAAPVWQVERVEWFEPNENLASATALAPSQLKVVLPVGVYRMVLTNQDAVQTRTSFDDANPATTGANGITRLGLAGPIWIQKDRNFIVDTADVLCPDDASDAGGNPDKVGVISSSAYSAHYFQTRELDSPVGNLQPLRITLAGVGTADPVLRRQRTLATRFDTEAKAPVAAAGPIPGQYQFRAGNELFGTGFSRLLPAEFVWLPNGHEYTAYASRGPLTQLLQLNLTTYDGQTDTSHLFTVTPQGLPPGWTSFDLPGPSQATTGGYLPCEKLASAMANGVQVVGATELDLQSSASALYTDFMTEFGITDLLTPSMRPPSLSAITRPPAHPCALDPFVVGARSSSLANTGTVTALFTPEATNARMGGAQDSTGWTLADFLTQAQGQFNVLHRPRGPAGLFTLQGAPAGASWWNSAGPVSLQKVNGDFDALELLRGEGLDSADPSAWFAEFKAVRADWFALLDTQTPARFTKALGLSSARYSFDTPVGLARTYLKASQTVQTDPSGVLAALQKGAAVASTGPFLDVSVGAYGPGDLVPGPVQTLPLVVNLWKTDWMPVHWLRVVVNGVATEYDLLANPGLLAQSGSDARMSSGTFQVALPADGKDAWVVVEAGVSVDAPPPAGPYTDAAFDASPLYGSTFIPRWNKIMRGIYPIAVTNPIFVNVTGSGTYTAPAAVQ